MRILSNIVNIFRNCAHVSCVATDTGFWQPTSVLFCYVCNVRFKMANGIHTINHCVVYTYEYNQAICSSMALYLADLCAGACACVRVCVCIVAKLRSGDQSVQHSVNSECLFAHMETLVFEAHTHTPAPLPLNMGI